MKDGAAPFSAAHSAHAPGPGTRTDDRGRPARAGLALAALSLCVGLVAFMALFLLREIEGLSRANSDNMQWTLAQADSEFLRFQVALERAEQGRGELAGVRRRFDVFYSRMNTLTSGAAYAGLRELSDFAQPQDRIRVFLDETVPLIDGPDAGLSSALSELAGQGDAVLADVRTMTLAGLGGFAETADSRREGLMQSLVAMAAVLALVFAGLVLLAYVLYRLFRVAKARKSEAQRAGERMRTIVETSPEAIVVTDGAGRIREFNPRAQDIFGCTRAEALGRSAIGLMFSPLEGEEMRRGRLAFLESGSGPGEGANSFEAEAVDSSGRRFPAEFAIARAEDGPLMITYVRDISARKAAEEALTEARDRALAGERAKADFLAVMSHEMRTPLNGLLGSLQLLRGQDVPRQQAGLLERMDGCGQQLLGLVNDVLDLSKFEAGKMTAERRPFALEKLIADVAATAAPMAEAGGNTLDWHWIGPARGTVEGDARRLRQVLLNLVGNAVKFTRGGAIGIEAECLGGAMVEFRVSDTGIGIAPGDLPRIFQDFETLDSTYARQAAGTGLGLGIARRLARLMGGEIGAESVPGEGSVFWLRVPLPAAAERVPEAPVADGAAAPVRPFSLLLVEDNEMNRYIACEMLKADGHRVREAVNGREGVEMAAAEEFDVILMDVSMPVMDGPEATRQIRQGSGKSASRPIIAVTAHALPEEVAAFRAAGMNDCINKPIDRTLLRKVLAEAAGAEPAASKPAAAARPADARARLIDPAQLESLWDGLPQDRRGALLGRFIAELDHTIGGLSGEEPGAPDLVARIHSCAGSCGTFGATALRRALARLETAAKQGRLPTRCQLQALAPLWADSRAALMDWQQQA